MSVPKETWGLCIAGRYSGNLVFVVQQEQGDWDVYVKAPDSAELFCNWALDEDEVALYFQSDSSVKAVVATPDLFPSVAWGMAPPRDMEHPLLSAQKSWFHYRCSKGNARPKCSNLESIAVETFEDLGLDEITVSLTRRKAHRQRAKELRACLEHLSPVRSWAEGWLALLTTTDEYALVETVAQKSIKPFLGFCETVTFVSVVSQAVAVMSPKKQTFVFASENPDVFDAVLPRFAALECGSILIERT